MGLGGCILRLVWTWGCVLDLEFGFGKAFGRHVDCLNEFGNLGERYFGKRCFGREIFWERYFGKEMFWDKNYLGNYILGKDIWGKALLERICWRKVF